jgi:putative ABC transport system permease protein
MTFGRKFKRLLNLPTRSDAAIDRDLDDEVAFHLEMRVRDLQRLGYGEADARRQAAEEFGDRDRLKRMLAREDRSARRDRRVSRWLGDFGYDLRFAARQLARNPMFAAIAIFTVAIGIGANTAIMSAVRGIVLRPLPFHEPDRLVRVYSRHERIGSTAMSVADFADMRAQATTFSGMAAWYETTTNLTGEGEPLRLNAAKVTDNWFGLFGIRPLSGRTFTEGEDRHGAPIRAVLSDVFWQRRFGGANVIGRTVTLDGLSAEIIGVVPAVSSFPAGADLWLTTRFEPEDFTDASRGARYLRVVGRLAPGVSIEQANHDVVRVAGLISQRDPRHNTGYSALGIPFQESLVGSFRRPLFILLGAVGLVMLVVCANVAGLMVARTAGRETEIAVRTALGAGRGRIVRQLVAESLVIALAGGVTGLALGVAGTYLLVQWAPPDIPRLDHVGIDRQVFAFSALLALVTGILFGLAPALHAARRDVRTRLQSGGRGSAGRFGGVRLRRLLVVTELAMAIVLLAGAGLLLRSFMKLQDVDPGFRATGLTAFTVTLPATRYAKLAEQRQFSTRLMEELDALPGVDRVAASFGLPLTDTRFQLTFTIDGKDGDPNNEPRGQVRVASHGYFDAMGIPLKAGRTFTAQDRWESPPVIVVSEQLAKRYFPEGNAIGRVISTGWGREGHVLGGTIVGIVGDVKQFGLSLDAPPAYYAPADQWPTDEVTFIVRTSTGGPDIVPAIRDVVKRLDGDLPIFDVTTGERLVSASLAQPRFYLMVILAFAVASLLLSAIGVYGIVAYMVRQRTREIGVRLALGATSSRITRMVVGEGLILAGWGIGLGILVSLLVGGQIQALLFGVDARDWITLAAVATVLGTATIAACIIPATWAARVGPRNALGGE